MRIAWIKAAVIDSCLNRLNELLVWNNTTLKGLILQFREGQTCIKENILQTTRNMFRVAPNRRYTENFVRFIISIIWKGKPSLPLKLHHPPFSTPVEISECMTLISFSFSFYKIISTAWIAVNSFQWIMD